MLSFNAASGSRSVATEYTAMCMRKNGFNAASGSRSVATKNVNYNTSNS